ncbi:MAG: sucrase ferredoxin, partial [Actinomycetales bacterium]
MVEASPATALSDSCSTLSASESLAGTAPYASTWIAIEQPGSWGRDALRSDALPNGVGSTLADRAKGANVGVLLVRHPDRPRQLADGDGRTVWIAHIGTHTLIRLTINDCRDLLSWDLPALAAGDLMTALRGTASVSAPTQAPDPLVLVCCHAARDACCAVHGRALYDALHSQSSPEGSQYLWQCSHLGGHRFAPTMLLLPLGAVYGRVTLPIAQTAITMATKGQLLLDQCRGRTHGPAPVQVAELDLRTTLDCPGATDLHFVQESAEDRSAVVVAHHRDGRSWRLTLGREQTDLSRPVSCGADPEL